MRTGTLTVPLANLAAHYGTIVTANAGAFDLAASDKHTRTLDGTNGALTLINAQVGQTFLLILVQDPDGGRAITSWFAGITWMTAGGAEPPLATAPGKINVFTFLCVGAGAYHGFLSGQNG